MDDSEQIKSKIPSCNINKETLLSIGNILESEIIELKKMDEEAMGWTNIEIESKNRTLKKSTVKALSETKIPRNLEKIWFSLHFNSRKNEDERSISVWIYFNNYLDPYFTVEGRDPNWVSGITHRLQEVFEETKTVNGVLRKTAVSSTISFVIVLVLGLGISFTTLSYLPEMYEEDKDDEYTLTWLTIVAGIVPMYFTFQWLFPSIEYENYLIQTRIKKIVLSGIGTIIIGLLLLGLSKLFL